MSIPNQIDINNIGSLIVYAINFLQNLLMTILRETIFKARPELAQQFSGALSLLTLITVVYLLLTFVTAFRKIIGYILLIGWALLILAIILVTYVPTP